MAPTGEGERSVELSFQWMDRAIDGARAFMIGTNFRRGAPWNAFYAGGRGGFVDSPVRNGFLGQIFVGVDLGIRSFGVHLEPSVWAAHEWVWSFGGQLLAGFYWRFSP